MVSIISSSGFWMTLPLSFFLGFVSSFLLSSRVEKEETVVIGADNGAVEETEDVAGLY